MSSADPTPAAPVATPAAAPGTGATAEAWPPEWLRAVLSLSVLQTIAAGPTYGYAIAGALSEAGLGDIKGGTLYPLLGRLTTAGLITENWQPGTNGPGRKYYQITAVGHQQLQTQAQQWHTFSTTVAAHLRPNTDQSK